MTEDKASPETSQPRQYWCCVPSKETNGQEHTIYCENSGTPKKWSSVNRYWGEVAAPPSSPHKSQQVADQRINDFDFLSALGERAPTIAYAGNARQYVDAVINNLAEVDAILPDSLGRSLVERIRLLLERANREAALAVELRQCAEKAEAKVSPEAIQKEKS